MGGWGGLVMFWAFRWRKGVGMKLVESRNVLIWLYVAGWGSLGRCGWLWKVGDDITA